jgi:hypothetical protein
MEFRDALKSYSDLIFKPTLKKMILILYLDHDLINFILNIYENEK